MSIERTCVDLGDAAVIYNLMLKILFKLETSLPSECVPYPVFSSNGVPPTVVAHKVRLPWDKGVGSQTPPEVVMLHCLSEERGDVNSASPWTCGRVCVHSTPSAREFMLLSVRMTDILLPIPHAFVCTTHPIQAVCNKRHRSVFSLFPSPLFTITIFIMLSLESDFMVPWREAEPFTHINLMGLCQRKLPSVLWR